MKASELLEEFNKGVGRDPRSRLDELEAFLRAAVEKEETEFEAPEPAKKAKRGE